MCGHGSSPSPPPSDDGSHDSDSSEGYDEPRLTPQELGALFIDFYSFMTTLNYDKSDLKIPPPTGWPEITSESCGYFKSDYTIEVMRHLPYLNNKSTAQIHYRSKLLELTVWTAIDFKKHSETHEAMEFWSSEDEQDPSDVICFAEGYGSYGRGLWLLVKDCEIIEELSEADVLSAVPVEEFFANLKEQYETLKLIPGERRIMIEAENVPDRKERITEDEVNSQTQEWGTDLDIQYVRQIYRDHGWPHSFNLETASRAIGNWLEPSGAAVGGGPRGESWPHSSDDWVGMP
ncbi:Ff.00g117450.m01.CDS01 [Fusarium sp. VM40]|nr:Ff.00g117450.m01.CDS01 [Fusarium sp. VM40]